MNRTAKRDQTASSLRRRLVEPIRVMRRLGTWRMSARKAARRDLQSGQPLVRRTPFQCQAVAAYRMAKETRLEEAAIETRTLKEKLAEIERRIRWRVKEVKEATRKLGELAKKLTVLHPTQLLAWFNIWTYLLLQGLFAVVEYPLIRIAFTRLPVSDGTIRLISILVGCVLVAGMHVFGGVAARAVPAEGECLEGRRDWLLHVAVLSAGLLFYVGVVIGLAVVRGSEISAVGEVFHGFGERHPGWLGVALAFLQAISLTGSFYVAYQHTRGAYWRAIKAEMAVLERRIEETERQIEELESHRDRLVIGLAATEEETAHHLERLLRFHEYLEAEYLAVLGRELTLPPLPVADWDADVDPGDSPASRRLSRKTATNGHRDTKAARERARALRDSDRKENTP